MPLNGSGSSPKLLPPRRPERALAVAALAVVLFHRPLLGIFDKGPEAMVGGVPTLFVYLFVAWTIVVALTALVMEARGDRSSGVDDTAPESGAARTVSEPASGSESS